MKVLYASRSRNVHDERFIDAWRSQGVVVEVLTFSSHELIDVAVGKSALDEVVRNFEPDVVQAGPIVDVGHLVASVWQGPLILTSWGFDLMDEVDISEENSLRAQRAMASSSLLITDNDMVTERAVELGMSRDGIIQFPWGVDLGRFSPDGPSLRDQLGWDDTHWVVGCTRSHEAYYDVQTVVEGFAKFAGGRPAARLLLAGGGSLMTHLKGLASRLGIEERTVFLGEVDHSQLAAIYRTFDAYVSASTVDGTSVSLLEAMACGVPVCVSDIPGNRQWVSEATGRVFRVGDGDALAVTLTRTWSELLRARPRSTGRQTAALALVRAKADWNKTAGHFGAMGRLAMSRHRGEK